MRLHKAFTLPEIIKYASTAEKFLPEEVPYHSISHVRDIRWVLLNLLTPTTERNPNLPGIT